MAEIADVLTKLLERTEEGKVPWKPTADENAFVAVVGSLSLLISQSSKYSDPVLKILNNEGRAIEELDGSLREGTKWKEQLWSMHQKARRIALNVGFQLDELVEQLDRAA